MPERLRGSDERIVDLAILVVIALLSLGVAWVCFAVLDSQAEGEFQAYTVGGALAGFVVTASLLWSIYAGLRRSSDELEKLRAENRELEHKLIRGVPHPEGYVVEVDEKERLVLARPDEWTRKGGTLYEFIKSSTEGTAGDRCPEDPFPARLTVSFEHADPDADGGAQEHYARLTRWMAEIEERGLMIAPMFEHVFVGEPSHGILSLKVAYSQWVVAWWERDPRSRRWLHSYAIRPRAWAERVNRQQREAARVTVGAGAADAAPEAAPTDGQPEPSGLIAAPAGGGGGEDANLVLTYRIDVICYHEQLSRIFRFEFVDDKTDFAEASTGFNRVLSSTRFLV